MNSFWTRLPIAARRGLLLLVLGTFILLAVVAHGLRADPLDLTVTRAVQPHFAWLGGVLLVVSWFGYAPQELVMHGVIYLAVLVLGYPLEMAALLLVSFGSSGIDGVVKPLVARPRPSPSLVHVFTPVGGYSFPSGHVMGYTSFFGTLAVLAWLRLAPGAARTGVLAVCVVAIGLVGLSRIYLGVHWFTDVVGGYLLGGLWLVTVLSLYRVARRVSHGARGTTSTPGAGD
jgi:membrane-associated phospholipid phosphatase